MEMSFFSQTVVEILLPQMYLFVSNYGSSLYKISVKWHSKNNKQTEISQCLFSSLSGIYLLDMIYINSAYPASDSIIETEQRSNQMNNLLRVISDLQMSCNYGKNCVTKSTYLMYNIFIIT